MKVYVVTFEWWNGEEYEDYKDKHELIGVYSSMEAAEKEIQERFNKYLKFVMDGYNKAKEEYENGERVWKDWIERFKVPTLWSGAFENGSKQYSFFGSSESSWYDSWSKTYYTIHEKEVES